MSDESNEIKRKITTTKIREENGIAILASNGKIIGTAATEHIRLLAQEFASRNLPVIEQFEPIADMEELLTFTEASPTPGVFTSQHPAWRLESVAARVIEAIAIAAHEPLTEFGYHELARILLEHTVYLYTYPDGDPRPRLEAASALALSGAICASLPQSELWRLAGFGRISAVFAEVAPAPTDSHLTLPVDAAFSLANERNLPILEIAVTTYNTVLKRNFEPQNQFQLPLTDSDFFDILNLDFMGMEAVKAAVFADNIHAAKAAYTAFRREFLDSQIEHKSIPLSERTDTYTTAKTYLECLLRLSIYPTPAITATTEIGIAGYLLPEFRGSEQLRHLALRRYQWIADAFFHADGFHKARTLRAHIEAIADFARFLRFQPDTQTEALQVFLERLVATCIHLSLPDYSFPPLGPLPAPNFDAIELCNIVNSDFKCPDTTSHALPETGCYVMRDHWEEDAQYLFFDARPSTEFSPAGTSHLILHAYGRQRTTGLVRVVDTELSASNVLHPRWITTPAFDFVEQWYQDSSVHCKRTIFYLKGRYFILHDLLLGGEARTMEQVFHFNSGVNAEARQIWTQDVHCRNIFIGATGTTDLSVALDKDTAIYRCTSELPIVLNTLLFPMRSGLMGHPIISAINVETDADVLATGFSVELSNTTDTFFISDDGLAEMSASDITFVGESLFLRRDASGSASQYIMLNGQFLQVGVQVLADLDEPCESYMLI